MHPQRSPTWPRWTGRVLDASGAVSTPPSRCTTALGTSSSSRPEPRCGRGGLAADLGDLLVAPRSTAGDTRRRPACVLTRPCAPPRWSLPLWPAPPRARLRPDPVTRCCSATGRAAGQPALVATTALRDQAALAHHRRAREAFGAVRPLLTTGRPPRCSTTRSDSRLLPAHLGRDGCSASWTCGGSVRAVLRRAVGGIGSTDRPRSRPAATLRCVPRAARPRGVPPSQCR